MHWANGCRAPGLESDRDGRWGCVTFGVNVTRRSPRPAILGRPRFDLSRDVPEMVLLGVSGVAISQRESLPQEA